MQNTNELNQRKPSEKLKITIPGATGRMGRILVETIYNSHKALIHGVTARAESPLIGKDIGDICGLGNIDLIVKDNYLTLFTNTDAVIDFTNIDCIIDHVLFVAQSP